MGDAQFHGDIEGGTVCPGLSPGYDFFDHGFFGEWFINFFR
jgi:hypothetical protein